MRRMFSAALIAFALPAGAQDFTYDPAILAGCLEAEQDNPEICIGQGSTACMNGEGGDSQVGISSCLSAEKDQWAMIMDASYAILYAEAERVDAEMKDLGSATDPQAPLLDAMQTQWAAYRDQACSWEMSRWGSGSGAGPAAAGCDMRLTGQQAVLLKVYADQAQ